MHISLSKSLCLHLQVHFSKIYLKSNTIVLSFLQKKKGEKEKGEWKRWQNFLYQAPSKEATG